MVAAELMDIPRIIFNMEIGLMAATPKKTGEIEICDLGGGIGLFSVGCAAIGMKRSVLVDDFEDSVNHRVGPAALDLHRSYGVEVFSLDVISKGIQSIPGTFDIVTTFDSMEHWHHSPKRLFHDVVDKLKPGGVFVLGVPNCVNMRKRITVPFGRGKWSSMEEWYEPLTFRGHVREPDVSDLHYIARDMGLRDVRIYGRNWLGYYSPNPVTRFVTKLMDHPLRLLPTLCSDIYVVGRKP
jgi:SAM-dependent methyltransferase